MKRILSMTLLVTLIFGSFSAPVFAEAETGAMVVTKLFRGIANAATGWMEIPKQMSLVWQESGPGSGVSWGLIKGVGYAVARSVAGAYDIVTFPFPIPEGYKPIIQPEYVLSDLSSGSPGKSSSKSK